MGHVEELRKIIRQIILEADKKKKILGEPDMSEEEERNAPDEIEEISLAGNVAGYMGPLNGPQGTTGVPDSRAKKSKRRKKK